MKILFNVIIFSLFSFSIFSSEPFLLGRYGVENSYNIPSFSYAPNVNLEINNNDDVALNMWGVFGEQRGAVWLNKTSGDRPRFLYVTSPGKMIHDLYLGEKSVLFTEGVLGEVQNVFLQRLDKDYIETIMEKEEMLEFGQASYPGFLNEEKGLIALKITNSRGSQRIIYKDLNSNFDGWKTLIRKNKDVVYIFSPTFNKTGQMAIKVWRNGLGEKPIEEILVYNFLNEVPKLQNKVLIPENLSLRNTLDISDNGYLAYFTEDNQKNVFLNIHSTINNHSERLDVTNFSPQYFSPVIANDKTAFFKGENNLVMVEKGIAKVILKEGDQLPTDLGKIPLKSKFSSNFTFTYGIEVNSRGHLTFKGSLQKPIDQGVGLFVLKK